MFFHSFDRTFVKLKLVLTQTTTVPRCFAFQRNNTWASIDVAVANHYKMRVKLLNVIGRSLGLKWACPRTWDTLVKECISAWDAKINFILECQN